MSAQPIPAVCYDLSAVSQFFRSVALAVAFQQHTQQEWVVQRDNKVINAIYSVMFWMEPPGVVEVRQASKTQIQATTDQLHERFLMTWVRKLHQEGPLAAKLYVTEMLNVRDHAREAFQEMMRDVNQINMMVANQLKEAIKDMAQIKLAGTVGVAVIGAVGAITLAPAGALICGGVSLGYSGTCSMIKDWDQGWSAKAVGVGKETAKAGLSEALGKGAESMSVRALAQQSQAQQIIRSCEGEIAKFSQRLSQEGLRKAQIAKARNIVNRATTQVAGQQQVLGQAARAGKLAGAAKVGVPLVFAAWDIWEGIDDYNTTMNGL